MKNDLVRFLTTILVVVAGISGCATSKKAELQASEQPTVDLRVFSITDPPAVRPEAVVLVSTSDFSKLTAFSWTRSRRISELKQIYLNQLIKMLTASNLFATVKLNPKPTASGDSNDDSRRIQILLTIKEADDPHTGAMLGKAFASGFFTLGLGTPTQNYTFVSEMNFTLKRWDGLNKEFATKATATAAYNQQVRIGMPETLRQNAFQLTTERVTSDNFKSLISQMVESRQFILGLED